jgi:hypothetical protein
MRGEVSMRKAVAASAAGLTLLLVGCKPAPRSVTTGTLNPGLADTTAVAAPVFAIAVLPLANFTSQREGPDRMEPVIAAELRAKPGIRVADAGAVQAALDKEPWLLLDRVPPDLVDRLGAGLAVQGLVLGSLLTYEYRNTTGEGVPQVSLALRLIECPGGRVLWSGVHSRDGDDNEWLFGFGRVHGLEQLARETVRELLQEFPVPLPAARPAVGAQGGK